MSELTERPIENDIPYILNDQMRYMAAGGGVLAFYTYTGCITAGFEMTVIGTASLIAHHVMADFYSQYRYVDTDTLKTDVDAWFDFHGPHYLDYRMERRPVPFTVEIVDGVVDATEYAFHRRRLQDTFKTLKGIDNLTYPAVRVVFQHHLMETKRPSK